MKYKLGNIAEVSAGQGAPQGESNYCDAGIPFVKAGNLQALSSGLDIYSIQQVNEQVAQTYKLKIYPKGTVLFAKSGMSCLKGYVYVLPIDAYVVNHLACITPKNIESEYLRFYFLYHKPNQLIKDASYPSISLSDISNMDIHLSDGSDTGRIINTLKKVESIITTRKQQLATLDTLIKARFVEMFGDPSLNTKGYPVKFLSDVANYWNGLTYNPEDICEKGTIVLRSSNIQNSQLDFNDTIRVSCKIGSKKFVQENDILMCSRNGSAKLVGKVALIQNIDEKMSFGAFMAIVRSEYYQYLMIYFQMPAFRSQITTSATTTINQITGRMLNNVKLPVPDMDTISNFSDFCKQVNQSKFLIQQAQNEAQTLFNSLMQKYFG